MHRVHESAPAPGPARTSTRRQFLQRISALGFAAPGVVTLLAACGGSSDKPTATAGSAPTAAGVAPTGATATPPSLAGSTTAVVTTPGAPDAPDATPAATFPSAGPTPTPVVRGPVSAATGHPRLWIREEDLPRLRAWATDSNPMWSQALLPRTEEAKAAKEAGNLAADDGSIDWVEYPSESYAQLFAFMSLIHPDQAQRDDYASRARTLLMVIMNEAVKGAAEGQPWRDPAMSVFNRSRWWGESYGLTVDWIYAYLSAEDKATIRTVFLRWADENTNATVTGEFNHPQPIGVVNDPQLVSNPYGTRWAINNYFAAHMRNIGLMALSFDAADDPDGALTGYLASATGAWLYMVDTLMRGESRGGMSPEGFEYSPQAMAYVIQFLLALRTAGQDDPARWGPQVVVENQPFWDDLISATLNSNSPRTVLIDDYTGPVYQPAWYGDGQNYQGPDYIDLFGSLGVYDQLAGNAKRLNAARWMQINYPPGGAESLLYRASGNEDRPETILHFLLFDPAAPAPTDPREGLAPNWYAPGIGRVLARTDWGQDAAWFTWSLGWQNIDHQHGDGLSFEFYRKGEWLTKESTGYGYTIACSDYHNTLSLENQPIDIEDPSDWRYPVWKSGSQWLYVSDDPPGGKILALSITGAYVYTLGDATALYNAAYHEANQITHASRSTIWLAPDVIVVYDRATTRDVGYFKRFWLQLPTKASVAGQLSTVTTASGQQLFVTTLLPTDATIAMDTSEPLQDEPAYYDVMHFRLKVEATGDPADVRFLHVLQGADAGAAALATQAIASSGGTAYAGALVGTTAVLFPETLGDAPQSVTYSAPGASMHYITGLTPGAGYSVNVSGDDVSVTAGGDQMSDSGGVLVIGAAAGA
jgi:hypothetical protein